MDPIILFVLILDAIGATSFALSGALAATKKHMDWFGAFVLACVTTFGGGIMRDLILNVPVIAFYESQHYIIICIISTVAVLVFGSHIEKRGKLIMLCDSIGLALFTISGTLRALNADAPWLSAIMLALITACGGGMIRDLLRNERPYVLYTDFYASASLMGSSLLVLMIIKFNFSVQFASTVCAIAVFLVRLVVLLKQWRKEQELFKQQRPIN